MKIRVKIALKIYPQKSFNNANRKGRFIFGNLKFRKDESTIVLLVAYENTFYHIKKKMKC